MDAAKPVRRAWDASRLCHTLSLATTPATRGVAFRFVMDHVDDCVGILQLTQ
jgi:hypothetical protein